MFLAACAALDAQTVPGTGAVVGRILNAENERPIALGTVRLGNTINMNLSSADRGGFALRNVPPGTQTLIVSCPGFNPLVQQITVRPNETTEAGDGGIIRLDPTYVKPGKAPAPAAPASAPTAPA